jgi:hypothetical protein
MVIKVTTTQEGFQYRIAVIADGKLKKVFRTSPDKVVNDRNRETDYWSGLPEVTEVVGNPIPPILTQKGGVR